MAVELVAGFRVTAFLPVRPVASPFGVVRVWRGAATSTVLPVTDAS